MGHFCWWYSCWWRMLKIKADDEKWGLLKVKNKLDITFWYYAIDKKSDLKYFYPWKPILVVYSYWQILENSSRKFQKFQFSTGDSDRFLENLPRNPRLGWVFSKIGLAQHFPRHLPMKVISILQLNILFSDEKT